ncbi:MAG: tetratricopeptide repeat protein [Hyphomonadaceae bacterium]
MSNESDSFIQEVDEGLRQDRMLEIGKKYGPWLIGAFVIVLAVVGGWQIWRDQQIRSARAQSDRYAAAQELAQQGNLDEAKAAFERLSSEGPDSYRTLARLEHASLVAQGGDLEAALSEFDAAAAAARDPLMRETAQLRAAYIAADTQDFAALRTRLQPLIDSGGRLSYLAKELLAIEAWEAGDTDLARSTLQDLTLAFDAPDSMRQRAQVALSVIGAPPEQQQDSADSADAPPAPSEGESK